MTLEDIFLIMRHDRNEFDKIFENGQFSLTEPKIICQLDAVMNADYIKENAYQFGCKIEGNNVILPANLNFSLTTEGGYVIITRNGARLIYCDTSSIEDPDTEFNVGFTDFGKKLNRFATVYNYDFFFAYQLLRDIKNIFGTNVIPE